LFASKGWLSSKRFRAVLPQGSADEPLHNFSESHLAVDEGRTVALELDPTFVESVEHLDAWNRLHIPRARKIAPLFSRGTASARIARCSAFESSAAIPF